MPVADQVVGSVSRARDSNKHFKRTGRSGQKCRLECILGAKALTSPPNLAIVDGSFPDDIHARQGASPMSTATPAAALEPIPRDPGWPIFGNLFQITPGEVGQHLLARSRHHDGIFLSLIHI